MLAKVRCIRSSSRFCAFDGVSVGQCGRTPLVCGNSGERLGFLVLSFSMSILSPSRCTQRTGLHLHQPVERTFMSKQHHPRSGSGSFGFPTLPSPSIGSTSIPSRDSRQKETEAIPEYIVCCMLIGAHHVEPTLAGNVPWKRPIPADIGHMVTAETLILDQKSRTDFF